MPGILFDVKVRTLLICIYVAVSMLQRLSVWISSDELSDWFDKLISRMHNAEFKVLDIRVSIEIEILFPIVEFFSGKTVGRLFCNLGLDKSDQARYESYFEPK